MTDDVLAARFFLAVFFVALFLFAIWEEYQHHYFVKDRKNNPAAQPCGGRIYTLPDIFIVSVIAVGIALFLLLYGRPAWYFFPALLLTLAGVIYFTAQYHDEYRSKPVDELPDTDPRSPEERTRQIIEQLKKRR